MNIKLKSRLVSPEYVLGGERLLEHLDLVVIDEEQHGETGFGDQMVEDVVDYLLEEFEEGERSKWASKMWSDLNLILY